MKLYRFIFIFGVLSCIGFLGFFFSLVIPLNCFRKRKEHSSGLVWNASKEKAFLSQVETSLRLAWCRRMTAGPELEDSVESKLCLLGESPKSLAHSFLKQKVREGKPKC